LLHSTDAHVEVDGVDSLHKCLHNWRVHEEIFIDCYLHGIELYLVSHL